jgi:DNA-binding transcriptional regulator YdaS (Cro superfamily)
MKRLTERRPIVRLALSRTEVALSIGVSVASVDQMVAEARFASAKKMALPETVARVRAGSVSQ